MIVKFCIMLLLLGAFSPPTLFAEKIIADGSSESPTVIEPLTSCPDGVFFSKEMSHRVHVHFNSLFPLGGMVSLNNGFLTLNRDLYCASNMILRTGGYCNGQHNTIFLPYSEDDFFFPARSLWLPPSGDESDEEDNPLYLPNLETAPIASWHPLPERDLLAVATSKNRNELSLYIFEDGAPKTVVATSFPAPIVGLYWSPRHHAGVAQTEEGLSYFSFDPSRNKTILLPSLELPATTTPPAWSGNGKYCAIGTKTSTPVINIYEHTINTFVLKKTVRLAEGQKITAVALNYDGTILSFAFSTAGKRKRFVSYDIRTSTALKIDSILLSGNPLLLKAVPGEENTFLLSVKKNKSLYQLLLCTIDKKGKIQSSTVLEDERPISDFSWHPLDSDLLGVLFFPHDDAALLRCYRRDRDSLMEEDETPAAHIKSVHINWTLGTNAASDIVPTKSYRLTLANIKLASNGPVRIQDPLHIEGSALWDGAWHHLSFAQDRYISIAEGSSLTLRHAILHSHRVPLVVQGEPGAKLNLRNTTLPTSGLCSHVPVNLSNNNTMQGELNGMFTVTAHSTLHAPTDTNITGNLTVNGTLNLGHKAHCLVSGKVITTGKGMVTGAGTLKVDGCINIENDGALRLIGTHLEITKDCVLTNGTLILENSRVSFGKESYMVHRVLYSAGTHDSLMNAVRG